jgi:hypothetical protein
MTDDGDTRGDLAYRARALTQAHPLTSVAKRYIDKAVAEERTSQPLPEIGIWAGAGMIDGYCVRRVEEVDAGLVLEPIGPEPDLDDLDQAASRIAAELRTDGAFMHVLGEEEATIAALDHIVASEVSNRLDHWRDSIDEKAWAELEEYLTWWIVKGYALRVAESCLGALA